MSAALQRKRGREDGTTAVFRLVNTITRPFAALFSRYTWAPSFGFLAMVLLLSYMITVSGTFYDILNATPALGRAVDAKGRMYSETIMPRRLNGQYIIEGAIAGGACTMAGVGFALLTWVAQSIHGKFADAAWMSWLHMAGLALVAAPLSLLFVFITYKVPGYLQEYPD